MILYLRYFFVCYQKCWDLKGKSFGVPITVDMRRYLKEKSFKSVTNLSSSIIINMAAPDKDDFRKTLSKVKSEINTRKNNFLGLNSLVKLDVLFKLSSKKSAFEILEKSLKHPKLFMTNAGIIDSSRLLFEGSTVESSFLSGSIKYRPHFQMCISTFNDTITLSVNLYGSKKDYDNVSSFFNLLDQEILAAITVGTM
jgi:NRPS condensation-like uncharacterized protein